MRYAILKRNIPSLEDNMLKKLSLILLLILSSLMISCSQPEDNSANPNDIFPKKTTVFGISVFATSSVSNTAIQHVASVLAEYLDSNSDGTPNDSAVVSQLQNNNVAMVVFANQSDEESFASSNDLNFDFVGMFEEEIVSPNGTDGQFDATLEEVLHMVTQYGYSRVYTDELGESVGSNIANAMDTARGGQFLTTPSSYPDGAWYTYNDTSCDYSCMITEYLYWGITSYLGAQNFDGRLDSIQHEWSLNTASKIQSTDTAFYSLLNDSSFNWPTVIPDGDYNGTVFDITEK